MSIPAFSWCVSLMCGLALTFSRPRRICRQVPKDQQDRASDHNSDVKREHYDDVVMEPAVAAKRGGHLARDGATL